MIAVTGPKGKGKEKGKANEKEQEREKVPSICNFFVFKVLI